MEWLSFSDCEITVRRRAPRARAFDMTRVDLPRLTWCDGEDTIQRFEPRVSQALPLIRVLAPRQPPPLPLRSLSSGASSAPHRRQRPPPPPRRAPEQTTQALPLVRINDSDRVARRERAERVERVAWYALVGVIVGVTVAIAGTALGFVA